MSPKGIISFLLPDGLYMLLTLPLHVVFPLSIKDRLFPHKADFLGGQWASRFLCNNGR